MNAQKLDFAIKEWLGTCESGDANQVTLSALQIDADLDSDRIPITEVCDARANTVRRHIYVPVYPIACWLLANWWRLRWEPRPQEITPEWRLTHSMASLGDGYAWPPVEFASDGEFIQIRLEAEHAPDAAAVRYLRDVNRDIPAVRFENAVEQLVGQIRERLSACQIKDRDLEDLQAELSEERSNPELSRACRWQAHAGIDPGTAPDGWLDEAESLGRTTGPGAIAEVMAVLPELEGNLAAAQKSINDIRDSRERVDLSWVGTPSIPSGPGPELPWRKGERLAEDLRRRLGLKPDKIADKELGGRLGVKLPLPKPSTGRQPLGGGLRCQDNGGRAKLLIPKGHPHGQRFYLARLIGCAMISSDQEILLPVTDTATAMQKFERAFAQELLCPWVALDKFTDEQGLDNAGIEEAAEYFEVSESLVRTTLVNKKKLPRNRLEMC